MSDDMSEMIQKMSEMLKNNEIPDNIKSIMNNLANSSSSNSSSGNTNEKISNQNTNSSNGNFAGEKTCNFTENGSYENRNSSSDSPNIDLNTMLKMKSVIDSMNQQQNDPRANLLRSLKPYLKPSRKEKIDQYIKLFNMGKVFEVLNPLGGEKKNDV